MKLNACPRDDVRGGGVRASLGKRSEVVGESCGFRGMAMLIHSGLALAAPMATNITRAFSAHN
ncbi:hypothetical protein, partial [Xanthobacter autotrophicus]|uniref:hypothetical protein n=1 Tax=Xanthobacter autotrophicus TaxID=280 RepID=UPI00372CA685